MAAQVVMITGAAGALGRVLAANFESAGANLVLVDVSDAALARAFTPSPRRLMAGANLLDGSAPARIVASAVEKFGRIDALCNIAGGFAMGTPVHATSPGDWKGMWDINVQTVVHTVEAVVPQMIAQRRGAIVNVGSMAALKGAAQMGAYTIAKTAVVRLTESMSAELREQGINVNCVLPSIIDTPANRAAMPGADPNKWVAPADLAAVIAFLCSNAARAVHGAALPVTGLS